MGRLIEAGRRVREALERWSGDRPDLQWPALGASLATHALILLAFGMIGYAAHTETAPPGFATEVVDTSLTPSDLLEETERTDLDVPITTEPVAGSFAPTVAPIVAVPVAAASGAGGAGPQAVEDLAPPPIAMAASVALPMATRLDQAVSIQGSGVDHVGAAEGGVDRLAEEILRRLEEGRTLVVWAFDASGSLQAERQRLAKHIAEVYKDVGLLGGGDPAARGLLTAVVAFGQGRKILAEPTDDASTVVEAIESVPLDDSGIESTFQTVADIARKYARFRKGGEPYRPMIIVVTDEVGDDEEQLEGAIAAAHSAKTPVFVLGSSALFGRVMGRADYKDPKTGRQYHNLPVRQGPESAVVEMAHVPFWFGGPQYDYLDAGFGPYALSRLAGATGGIYFVTRMGQSRPTFDPAGMREYKPDWVSRAQYEAAVAADPLRRAVLDAGRICQQTLPGQPELHFPAVESPAFKEAMTRGQQVAARVAYTVDEALAPVLAAARYRDHETSRRWQAHYDLIRGRLLAMKVRCYEYNWACAQMKKDPKKFTEPDSNAWRLVPDAEVRYSDKAAAAGREAVALLKRVVADHPGTPWALLAQRELKDPLGFRWAEHHVAPPRPNNGGGNNNPAPRKDAGRPRAESPPPKL